jgi:hypothetical protein
MDTQNQGGAKAAVHPLLQAAEGLSAPPSGGSAGHYTVSTARRELGRGGNHFRAPAALGLQVWGIPAKCVPGVLAVISQLESPIS